MTLPYGLEKAIPEHTNCPNCGAPVLDMSPEGDEIFKCGSIYPSKEDLQSTICRASSHSVRRRFATITGILDACDLDERKSILENLFIKYKDGK